jgi:hypothetical protein
VFTEQEIGMELFFMMTAMLALLGPIAVGRVRCIRIAPRLLDLVNGRLQTPSRAATGVQLSRGRDVCSAVARAGGSARMEPVVQSA